MGCRIRGGKITTREGRDYRWEGCLSVGGKGFAVNNEGETGEKKALFLSTDGKGDFGGGAGGEKRRGSLTD